MSLSSCNLIRNQLYKPFYYSEKSKANFIIEVPYTISDSRIYLDLLIEGKECKLLFDTGSRSYINKSLKEELNLYSSGKVKSKDVFQKTIESEQVTALIKLNELKIYNFKLTVKDFNEDSTNQINIDGVLGNNILNQGIFHFQPITKILKISNTIENIDLNGFEKIKLKTFLGDILIKYHKREFIIDSGFNGFMIMPKSSALLVDSLTKKDFTELWTGLNSSNIVLSTYQQHTINIGEFKQSGIATYIDLFDHFLIGNDLFLKNEVVIDISNKHIYLKNIPSSVEETPPSLYTMQNIRFGYIRGKTVITSIASKLGLYKVGAEILMINSIDVSMVKSEFELNELLKNMIFKTGISLTLKKDNHVEKIYIAKNKLY
jgi:predicted aspartyl protease